MPDNETLTVALLARRAHREQAAKPEPAEALAAQVFIERLQQLAIELEALAVAHKCGGVSINVTFYGSVVDGRQRSAPQIALTDNEGAAILVAAGGAPDSDGWYDRSAEYGGQMRAIRIDAGPVPMYAIEVRP